MSYEADLNHILYRLVCIVVQIARPCLRSGFGSQIHFCYFYRLFGRTTSFPGQRIPSFFSFWISPRHAVILRRSPSPVRGCLQQPEWHSPAELYLRLQRRAVNLSIAGSSINRWRVAALVQGVVIAGLIARLILPSSRSRKFVLNWSIWRRQHQANAALAHYKSHDMQL